MYDLVLKGGEVVDPARRVHAVMDVAIKDGRIAAVAKEIAPAEARNVLPVAGKVVAPGLIDIHCHCAQGLLPTALHPDEIGLDSGVTLLCDGGSSGPQGFRAMRSIMDACHTDVFCFLNAADRGLVATPEISREADMDLERAMAVIEENRDVIKGVKLRAVGALADGPGMRAVERAKKLADDAGLPFVLHIGDGRDRVEDDPMDDFTRAAIRLMDEGDILTHFMTWAAGGLILPDGTVYPELIEARDRGVLLDACPGFGNFSFTLARLAMGSGLVPDVLGTDLAARTKHVVQSLAVTMSKFLNLGLTIDQVIAMTTINAAKALGEKETRGSLAPGAPAMITVMEVVEGDYLFSDGKGGGSLRGGLLIEPRMVVDKGAVLPCLSRYAAPATDII